MGTALAATAERDSRLSPEDSFCDCGKHGPRLENKTLVLHDDWLRLTDDGDDMAGRLREMRGYSKIKDSEEERRLAKHGKKEREKKGTALREVKSRSQSIQCDLRRSRAQHKFGTAYYSFGVQQWLSCMLFICKQLIRSSIQTQQ